jgi:hypothetical protein
MTSMRPAAPSPPAWRALPQEGRILPLRVLDLGLRGGLDALRWGLNPRSPVFRYT